ncbi:hypothetical protein ISCGN_017013 [Ixodes scapularis]
MSHRRTPDSNTGQEHRVPKTAPSVSLPRARPVLAFVLPRAELTRRESNSTGRRRREECRTGDAQNQSRRVGSTAQLEDGPKSHAPEEEPGASLDQGRPSPNRIARVIARAVRNAPLPKADCPLRLFFFISRFSVLCETPFSPEPTARSQLHARWPPTNRLPFAT